MSKPKSWLLRIRHMIKSIEKIQSYTDQIDEEDFYADQKTLDAVERNFEIMGEALKHIPDNIKETYSDIEWLDIRDMRNFIAHQYDDVEEHVLWKTVQKHLPSLKNKLLALVKEEA